MADALNFLHKYTNPPYINKNLKSGNIVLDGNFRAKVSNFGLARVVKDKGDGRFQLTRHVVGTQGYMAPKYFENGLITPKMDVFAFDIVILELLIGREAIISDKSGLGEKMLATTVILLMNLNSPNLLAKSLIVDSQYHIIPFMSLNSLALWKISQLH